MTASPNKTRLIWIHIEKTAGNSFRILTYANYGRENVFWSGINSSKAFVAETDVIPYSVVGGHWPKRCFESHTANHLYCAIVREPVARMKSLYNFTKTKMDDTGKRQWLDWGFDPHSLSNTLRNSRQFVNMIANRQCWMLTGYADFESALKVLRAQNYIIGTFDNKQDYLQSMSKHLNWHTTNLQHINKGDENYQDGLTIDDSLLSLVDEICAQDQLLYNEIKRQGVFNSADPAVTEALSTRAPAKLA